MMNLRAVRLSTILALAVTVAASLGASAAAGGRPTIVRTPVEDTFVDSIDCAFPVEVYIKGTDTTITSVVQGDVREFHSFGGGHATLTNLDTGKSITINIAGPVRFTFGKDGSFTAVGTGTALFLFEDTPGIQWFRGRFTFSIDAEGNETSTTTGSFVDMCAALAG
jgi:hypothetical protein